MPVAEDAARLGAVQLTILRFLKKNPDRQYQPADIYMTLKLSVQQAGCALRGLRERDIVTWHRLGEGLRASYVYVYKPLSKDVIARL